MDMGYAYRSIAKVKQLYNPKSWFHTLDCSACGFLVTGDKYVMCAKEGHLTCSDCWEENPELVCQFRKAQSPVNKRHVDNEDVVGTDASERKGSAGGSKTTLEGLDKAKDLRGACGGVLVNRPNIFMDNLLKLIKIECPYAKDGCIVSVNARDIHTHYKLKCPFNPHRRAQREQQQQQWQQKQQKRQ